MRGLVSQRFAAMDTSAMAAAAAQKYNYENLIDLSIGDTDFATDPRITKAAMADALAGHTHYTSPKGDPELIAEIAAFYKAEYGMAVPQQQICVTASSCFGMSLALMAMLNPGDEVLLFAPYFFPYKEQVELAGGVAVEVATKESEGFSLNEQAIRAAITPKTRALILNNPCNPTGAAYDRAAYQMLAALAQELDLAVLADEIYTDYMIDRPFVPFCSLPGMAQRTVTLNSFSKNYLMTGWRVGYVIAPPPLVAAMVRINENLVYSAPAPSQRAALHALRLRGQIGTTYTDEYKKRVLYAAQRINAMEKLSVLPPQGTFYLFVNIQKTGLCSQEFCRVLLEKAQVAVVAGSGFGAAGEGYVRIACTASMPQLQQALDRIAALQW